MSDSHSFDNMAEDLEKLIRQSHSSLEAYLPSFQKVVDSVIMQGSTDTKEIEHLLDSLSSLLYVGIGHQLYLRLLDH